METTNIPLGTYEHYKGKRYEVLSVARHSETLEELVVYRALYGDHDIWVRPIGMFTEDVKMSGVKIPRFRRVESEDVDGGKK